MKNFTILIFYTFIICSCQQKVSKKETAKEIPVEASVENSINKITGIKTTISKSENKMVIDTIWGMDANGIPLKVLVYKYYSNKEKYLSEFDIINIQDSVVFSSMNEKLYEEEQRSEEDFLIVDMTPFYFLNKTSPLLITMGLHLKNLKGGADYCLSQIIDYKKNTSYKGTDSLLQFLDISFNNKAINSISVKITPNKSKISVDSLYSLKNYSKTNNALWIKQELCVSSLSLFLNDSISFRKASEIHPKNLKVGACETYVPQYLFKVLNKHYSFLKN